MNKFLSQLTPEDQTVSDILQSNAQSIQVTPQFQSNLEARLKQAHPANKQPSQDSRIKILPAIGWAILAISAFLVLNWAIRALIPNLQPAAGETAIPTATEVSSFPNPAIEATPLPAGNGYDWRGMTLYLDAVLPENPAEANVYQLQPEQPASLESVRALAEQFGLNGNVYEAPSELGNSDNPDFIVVAGNQHLRVRSNLYFSYYPDYTRWATGNVFGKIPDQDTAEELIGAFLRTHGFDFAYKVQLSEFYTGYYALPLTPDGFAIQHEHFNLAGFLFRFDDTGIIAVEASLMDYTSAGTFEIIPAESAFQKILDPNAMYGIREGMHSAHTPVQAWYRTWPRNQTITLYGWINTFKSQDGGAPLVTLDGYTVTGNLAGISESMENTFIAASGQFQTVDGREIFNIENWQVYEGADDGLQGTIQRDGDQVVITTFEGLRLTLPDVPPDLPLPIENAYALGIIHIEKFEFDWKSIDTRMQGGGGGGGGGGGSGFYKPNLTGTPVPLPTAQAPQATGPGTGEYIVQEGDTLSAIAESYGITVDELMQANGLNEAIIFVGQTLLIPGAQEETSLVGQRIDSQRGMLTVTIASKLDGSQSVDYRLQVDERENRYQLMKLEGDDLDELQTRNNLPIDIWGTVERYDTGLGMSIPVVNVERFEIPYPDLQYQIFKGTQSIITVQGETITLFTTEDGQTYAQANGYGDLIGLEGDQVLMEAVVLPDETIADYPVLQVVSASMAVNPKNGQPVELEITANKPYIIEETERPETPANLTATIESVELVYFTPNQRYKISDPSSGPVYIQPVWRFQGHYWDGSEFEILVQALKDEFLLPEIETIEPPG